MEKREIGDLGENLTCARYILMGYTILARNYRGYFGEIDIIAQKGDTVAFVEVKTRKDDSFYPASRAVNYSKQQRLRKTAQEYVDENSLENLNFRFDIAEVYHPQKDPEINIIENAF